jgi:hypothetical protein
MARKRFWHCIGVLLPKLGAALNVGEKKGDGACGEIRVHSVYLRIG